MECSICLENFDRELKLPILLECGHTFCKSCLDTTLLGHSFCPIDNSPLSKHLSQYKPNYSLLEMIDKFKDLLSNQISNPNPHSSSQSHSSQSQLILTLFQFLKELSQSPAL